MTQLYRRTCLTIAVCLGPWTTTANAQVITSAVRGGTSTQPAPVVITGGMNNGALTYNDRTHVYQQVPAFLQGIDFVQVSNVDRAQADYTLDVTSRVPARLFLFIDNRVGDGVNTDPPTLTTVMTWVAANSFTTDGTQIAIDENNDGSINNFFTVYSKLVPAGATRLFEQNDGTGRNMYGVAAAVAAVPEPTTLVLSAVGGLIFVVGRTRRGRGATPGG